jgi:hypothetical protein
LIGALRRFLTPLSDARRFDWLYKFNPVGVAKAWIAKDAQTERIVGTAAAFPRRYYLGEQEVCAWVFGDFAFDPEYRSLGPAVQLQRACLNVTNSGDGMFAYDFPSAAMIAVYKRLGHPVTQKMLRFAKLLRVDRRVRDTIKLPLAQPVLSAVGNTVLKLLSTKIVPDASLEVSIHHGPCGEEFSEIAYQQGRRWGVCIQRSAEYLNWRYLHHPLTSYEIITARCEGRLKSYVIWTQAGEDASIVDLFGENDSVVVKALLTAVVRRLSKSHVTTLSIWLNESHPWISACAEMDFRAREALPMVCVASPAVNKLADVRSRRWFLMHGDRDS